MTLFDCLTVDLWFRLNVSSIKRLADFIWESKISTFSLLIMLFDLDFVRSERLLWMMTLSFVSLGIKTDEDGSDDPGDEKTVPTATAAALFNGRYL